VLPVATDSGLCWSRRAFFKYPGTIHIAIQPPIPPGLPREALLERLTQSLANGAAELARPCG
jgi:1-acyl-sn-glycerol-3-phosphate acyltransferase